MRHQNSVFHGILKFVPWAAFDQLVEKHGSDELVRKFTTRNQLIALLFGQFSGAASLRDIEAAMASHRARLYHLGGKEAPRSTLADANRCRSPLVFSELFERMLGMATPALRRKMGETVRLIDFDQPASGGRGRAMGALFGRGLRRQGACRLRPRSRPPGLPCRHGRQRQRHRRRQTNTHQGRRDLCVRSGLLRLRLVGASLHEADCRIVTRFKSNTPLHQARDMPIAPGSGVLSDRIGFLPARQAKSRKNPMQEAVREVVVMTETGKKLRILSNDLDAPAKEIADLYKRRWQIELFFRLMKQMLRITHFVGRSENAVRIQIAVALIAFLILHMLQAMTKAKHGFLELVRTRARQSDASKGLHPLASNTHTAATRPKTTCPKLGKYMNRTAVGQARP